MLSLIDLKTTPTPVLVSIATEHGLHIPKGKEEDRGYVVLVVALVVLCVEVGA